MQFKPGLDKWDNWFMKQAFVAAEMSKDPSTKVGAVIVKDRRVISTGYNGPPRGVLDHIPYRNERPEKYFWYEHAERNAIYNAAAFGMALAGATIYCFWMPCHDCARAIIQSGIVEIVYYETMPDRWNESQERAIEMLTEAKITHRRFGGNR